MPLQDLAKPLQIGPVSVRNRVVLAPMSGVTDLPFRQLAWRYGAGLVVTEMVASRELAMNRNESWARLKGTGISPHMVQLAGREPYWMAEAAKIAEANGADIIDINMGCPAKKVTGGYSGSALMRDPDLALSIIEATVKAVSVPVTLKMRLGWDENSLNAPDIAARAEAAGIKLVTVHGRTRMQFYEGRADWDAIRRVRDVVSIPLIANGDVETAEDAAEIMKRSGADAVMVGRATQGRPWHAGMLAGHPGPQRQDIPALVVEHYEAMLELYGRDAGIRHARKQLGWYLDRFAIGLAVEDKSAIMLSKDADDVSRRMLEALTAGLTQAVAATLAAGSTAALPTAVSAVANAAAVSASTAPAAVSTATAAEAVVAHRMASEPGPAPEKASATENGEAAVSAASVAEAVARHPASEPGPASEKPSATDKREAA